MKKIVDLTGGVFNNLKVINFSQVRNKNSHWLCECLLCGNLTEVSRPNLRSGNTQDCGCTKSEKISAKISRHNQSKSSTWNTWSSMRRRIRIGERHSKIYGEINMDDSWNTFENFLKDMGERPKGMSIDRIDNNKGYFKENCRWATQAEQNRNRSTNVILDFKGKLMCATDWAKEIGVHRDTIRRRIKRGLPIEKILEYE
jgi:hypothetical protein